MSAYPPDHHSLRDQHEPRDPELIEATAAVWLSLRDRGMTPSETAEFMRWLQVDARHVEVFNQLDAVWKDCDQLARLRPEPDNASAARVPAPLPRRRQAMRTVYGLVAAAAAFALVAYVGLDRLGERGHTAETAVGAYQSLDLPDGSVVRLNTDSAVDIRYSDDERHVRLARGEAYFTVAPNAAQPFVVVAGPVAVRAVGTAFNVRRHDHAIEVLVTEGKVQVNDAARGASLLGPASGAGSPLLHAGERALFNTGAPDAPHALSVTAVDALELGRTLAWQERRLEFDALPLQQVVAEFNRYNRTKLVLVDPRLAAKRFSGTFRADGYEPFVRLLEESFGVAAEREADVIRLRRAHE